MSDATEAVGLLAERDKLQAFKTWVHDYLDAHSVPHHPPGTHGAEGCRIGDRMDWLMDWLHAVVEKRTAAEAERDQLLQELEVLGGTVAVGRDYATELERQRDSLEKERDALRRELDGLREKTLKEVAQMAREESNAAFGGWGHAENACPAAGCALSDLAGELDALARLARPG